MMSTDSKEFPSTICNDSAYKTIEPAISGSFHLKEMRGFWYMGFLSRSFSIFELPDRWELFPGDTAHLWFLNYLFFMSLFAYLLKSLVSKYARLTPLMKETFFQILLEK